MSPSAALDERVFSEIKRLCFSGLDDLTLLREVASRLQRAVPFEAYCASTMDPTSGLITRSTAEGMGGMKAARSYLEHIYLDKGDVNECRFYGRRPLLKPIVMELSEYLYSTIGVGSCTTRWVRNAFWQT